jgi:hypothetical protein
VGGVIGWRLVGEKASTIEYRSVEEQANIRREDRRLKPALQAEARATIVLHDLVPVVAVR